MRPRCVYHGWKFNADGNCVDMPSSPPTAISRTGEAKSYPVREKAGVVWAYMGPADAMGGMPELEWTGVPDDQRYMRAGIRSATMRRRSTARWTPRMSLPTPQD